MAGALTGFAQLVLLIGFVGGVVYLNSVRPANTHYRPFRVTWWVPTVAACMLVLLLASWINVPHHLQHTNLPVARRHAEGRDECRRLLEAGAQHVERAALFAGEYYRDKHAAPHSKGPSTVSSVLSPLLNAALFNSGVTVTAVPLLLYLLVLHVRRPGGGRSRQYWLDMLRRESGVLLPVLNFISLVSAFTAPTFYLFVQPGRVDRCIYTSGHWFTFSITLLTFAVIVAHLASYQRYCRSSGRLLAIFVVWLAVYAMCALPVLKRTQEAFHDSTEAVDGIRQALPAFVVYLVFFIALQYITFLSTDSEADVEQSTQRPAVLQSDATGASAAAEKESAADAGENETEPLVKSSQSVPEAPKVTAARKAPAASPKAETKTDDTADTSAIPDAPPPPPPAAPAAPALAFKPKPSTAPASRPAPPAPSGRDAMLDEIGSKKWKLRKTEGGGTRSAAAAAPAVGFDKLIANLRKVVEPDGERDAEEDEKWE